LYSGPAGDDRRTAWGFQSSRYRSGGGDVRGGTAVEAREIGDDDVGGGKVYVEGGGGARRVWLQVGPICL
jgi:hypothetical protein